MGDNRRSGGGMSPIIDRRPLSVVIHINSISSPASHSVTTALADHTMRGPEGSRGPFAGGKKKL